MYFPITDVTVNPWFLAGVGFMVGLLGGFFGVGGGFLAGPMMFLVGVPMNFVVGTDLAHMTGKSIVAARRHRVLGHVDMRLGLLMVLGTVPGIEIGARIIEGLESSGSIDITDISISEDSKPFIHSFNSTSILSTGVVIFIVGLSILTFFIIFVKVIV